MTIVTVSLSSAYEPAPVNVTVGDTLDGEQYMVYGSVGEFRWLVPGGRNVLSDGTPLTRVDNRAPANVDVRYVAVDSQGGEAFSDPIQVTVDGENFPVILQTLDGATSVAPALLAGDFADGLKSNHAFFEVDGQAIMRYGVPARASSSMSVMCTPYQTGVLKSILADGAPIVYRCVGRVRDIDPCGIIAIEDPDSVSYVDHDREWSLEYRHVRTPSEYAQVAGWTWETGFDAAMISSDFTWAEFDEMFDTWDDFSTADWGQWI